MYRNPVLHESVMVCDAIQLLSVTDVLVVYRNSPENQRTDSGTGGLIRAQVVGPASYIPAPGEVVHQFIWSGKTDDGRVCKAANKFQILRTGPQRWALDIKVITSDKATATVQVRLA